MGHKSKQKQSSLTFEQLMDASLHEVFIAVERGLSPQVVDQGAKYLGVPKGQFSALLQISSSTLSRLSLENRPLSKAASDRVARVARIASIAENALGGGLEAAEWLNNDAPALGSIPPLSQLDTDAGAMLIEQLLVRAQDGIYG